MIRTTGHAHRRLGWSTLGQSGALPPGWTQTASGPVDTAIQPSTLRVCDAKGGCAWVPFASYEAAAQLVNVPGSTIAAVLSQIPGATTAPNPGQEAQAPPPPPLNVQVPATAAAPPPALPPTTQTNVSPISASQSAVWSQATTADYELIENTLSQYGDTWDSATAIQSKLYAAGSTPGTITQSQVLGLMTGTTATAAPSSSLSSITSSIPTWGWLAIAAAGGFLLLGGRKK